MAGEVLRTRTKDSLVIGLVGDLGGGKTTFLQGFAKGLGIKEKILSPTFIIIRKIKNFYHIDCYRIKKAKELLDLGFRRIISSPGNIVAIEWADRVKSLLPKNYILVKFEFVGSDIRKITIERRIR